MTIAPRSTHCHQPGIKVGASDIELVCEVKEPIVPSLMTRELVTEVNIPFNDQDIRSMKRKAPDAPNSDNRGKDHPIPKRPKVAKQPQRRFYCTGCKSSFARIDSLTRHEQDKHGA